MVTTLRFVDVARREAVRKLGARFCETLATWMGEGEDGWLQRDFENTAL
jgi:hypothetical protein